jgi:glycosyltransferase involved in cell wall biosynthesis
MKKIGIDARLYFQTGVGTYIQNLLGYLEKMKTNDITFYIYVMEEDAEKITFTNPHFIMRKTDASWHGFKEQAQLAALLYKDNLDLMHFTYFSSPVFYQKKFITTIHDITNVLFKTGKASTKSEKWYTMKHQIFKFVLKNQIRNSVAIITPTRTTKNQIVSLFGAKYKEKIIPIYEGINRQLESNKKPLPKSYPSSYLLYIGNFYPHKNIERLIAAYADVKTDIPLLLHGPKDYFSSRTEALIREKKLQNKIILDSKYVDPDILSQLYLHAKALIFPSLSEGFGLPIVEAMKYNLPILASDIPVFKELLDSEYTSFDPYDTQSITKAIESFIRSPHSHNYSKHISKFSFEHMAEETFKVYIKYLT